MLRNIELAALPSTLQLCLRSAEQNNGLVKMYRMRVADQRVMSTFYRSCDGDDAHAFLDVESLQSLGLLTCNGMSSIRVFITPRGLDLLNTGSTHCEVAA